MKRNRGKSVTDLWKDPVYRAKQMAARSTPEYLAGQRAAGLLGGATKGGEWSYEQKAAKAKQQTEKWQDEAYHAMMCAAHHKPKE